MEHTGLVEPLPGNRLYHYTSLRTAMKYILPNLTLRLGPIMKTNDPRENKSFRFGHISRFGTKSITVNEMHELDRSYCNIIRKDCKVLCFCDDYKRNFGHNLSNMWAHYGDKHKGVCLIINKAAFIQENKHLYNFELLRKVRYTSFNPQKLAPRNLYVDHTQIEKIGLDNYLKKFRLRHLRYLFFTKKIEWQTECEIRLLHISEKPRVDEFCSIKESLREIYLSVDFHPSLLNELRQILKGLGIKIHIKEHENIGLVSRDITE